MRTYEALSVAYFLVLAAGAAFAAAPAARRARGAMAALAAAAGVWSIARVAGPVVRDCAPLLYVAAAYWIPALMTAPGTGLRPAGSAITRFEAWLLRSDDWLRDRMPAIPMWARPWTEIAYLACYPLVPLGFAFVLVAGTPLDVTRFWNVVLLCGYACYGTLPWLRSRPPRVVAPPRTPTPVAHVNVYVLGRVSHGWNTFPSGHAAMSFAVAAAIAPVSIPVAFLAGAVAAGVALGAAAGRYHYVIDVLLGGAVTASVAVVMFV